jgi:hypothetical protein
VCSSDLDDWEAAGWALSIRWGVFAVEFFFGRVDR